MPAAIAVLALLPSAAQAGSQPEERPMLRIEPGMHAAPIRRIGADEACTSPVTGSPDKTSRLWSLPKGEGGNPELLRTLL